MRPSKSIRAIIAIFACLYGSTHGLQWRSAQSVNFERLQRTKRLSHQHSFQTPLSAPEYPEFPPQTFDQILDHKNPTTSPRFKQRYWVSTRHYKPGGPVIVIDGGETSGEDRLPFLDTGIADILAEATNGLGVILEHRYYGESIPVSNFTTDSLRWLNNYQALEDSAYFLSNVTFSPSLFPPDTPTSAIANLTALNTPWIYYGGSYAGARAAHMRVLYPELVFGAIASSAVTHAEIENWEYMDIIRTGGPGRCTDRIKDSIAKVDALLSRSVTKRGVKVLFGLQGLEYDDDFVSVLSWPLSAFQGKNWDPAVNAVGFDEFCAALIGESNDTLLERETEIEWGEALPLLPVDVTLLRYAAYIRRNIVPLCPSTETQEDCFGTHDESKFQSTSLSETWRAWTWQVCNEWGYFVAAPPDPEWPSIISRLIDVNYEAKICKQAFLPGEHVQVPEWPNVAAVNSIGDFSISYDRLAFIDGEIDPWRPCTPHSRYAPVRADTISRPFKLIPDGVHHHDQNGLKDHSLEPEHIQRIHREEVEFVKRWLDEWVQPK